ncbi:restriction endonuclease [Thermaerobacillus caldiproteolyticus]|uniref:restriction endonuclease n=1 Tax=Thermaerobacillus caldiproteolyticus TaxID=247480 RepID=UPI0018F25C8E|nr:restriction endonuclease [Anoxybacillus caldiproteolyticus]
MAVWLVRAGRNGEQQEAALENGVAVIGWNELPDLSNIQTREQLKKLFNKVYPKATENEAANKVGQIWAFIHRIQVGDLVALPLKYRSAIAIGKVVGTYQYRTDIAANIRHTIPVEWIRTDIPRTAFDQDLLYSLGAFMTVCQIKRNNAEERIRKIVGLSVSHQTVTKDDDDEDVMVDVERINVEDVALDQIRTYISRKFAGHNLAELVNAILQAEGYTTEISPPGPDGGVDILAGTGPMGFGFPRLCVQVKSSQSPVGSNVFSELLGTISKFGADQGLLVSWGGFKNTVIKDAKNNFFKVRLWDSDALLKAVLRNYDKFPDSLQAELPLKRVWALVQEDE